MEKPPLLNERILFGGFIMLGYFGLALLASLRKEISPEERQTIRDVLLTVGPILGMIAQSIWKTNVAEATSAQTLHLMADKLPTQPENKTTTIQETRDGNGNGNGAPPTETPIAPMPQVMENPPIPPILRT